MSRAVENKNRTAVLDALAGSVEIELPKSIIEQEASALMQRQVEQFQQQGMKAEDVGLTIETFMPEAENRVRIGLVLGDVIKANDIKATDEARTAFIEDQASSYEDPKEVVEWYAKNPQAQKEIDSILVEKEIANMVMAEAKVKESKQSFDEVVNMAR